MFFSGDGQKTGFCPSPQKTQPQLFLTPRVKRQCDEWDLPFAGSEPAGGIYIPAVVGNLPEVLILWTRVQIQPLDYQIVVFVVFILLRLFFAKCFSTASVIPENEIRTFGRTRTRFISPWRIETLCRIIGLSVIKMLQTSDSEVRSRAICGARQQICFRPDYSRGFWTIRMISETLYTMSA